MNKKHEYSAAICTFCGIGIVFCILLACITGGVEHEPHEITEKQLPEPTFDDLLDAICYVESGCQSGMMGDAEPLTIERKVGATAKVNYRAIGAYQLHKIYVDDVNRTNRGFNNNVYTYEDRWDKEKSRKMVSEYLGYYHGVRICSWPNENYADKRCLERMARIHNGGPDGWKKESTKEYWEKVKARLEVRQK